MTTLIHSTPAYTSSVLDNWLFLYKNYVANAEFNRIGWAATAIAIQGCILSPVLLLTMAFFGGGDWQFMASMICFLSVLIPILSALPVKYIFSSFAISVLVHVAIILINVL
ncbi:hypothetical protein [Spirosoma flavum]|uniref:Uncharacterized protein n=1 Tax=Spirosoma flavum TaxID=2048557 RepID=A0ABW6AKA1_9BACT